MKRVYTSIDDDLNARMVKYNEDHPEQEIALRKILRIGLNAFLEREGY